MVNDRFSRQSFLGPTSQERIASTVIGLAGLGGGGSHFAQQLAHIGFQNYVIYDDDVVEDSNLNRLVGATTFDAKAAFPKLYSAQRMIYGLQPDANVVPIKNRWQSDPDPLKSCHIVFGGVDTIAGRAELEVFCRRYLINYIDIGMDVYGTNPPVIAGQVILSSPRGPCMRCMDFINEGTLGKEAARYGNAGGRPQVIWANGVLASTAIGIAIDLITDWTGQGRTHEYLAYDGNAGTMKTHRNILGKTFEPCPHFPLDQVGDPFFEEI